MPEARPSPSNRRLVCALIGSLLLGILASGCSRRTGPAAVALPRVREGYAYVAPLMSEHPLYQQLRRLDQEIASLRAQTPEPAITPPDLRLHDLVLAAPTAPVFPLLTFTQQRTDWEQGRSLLQLTASTPLAPDIAAELAWSRSQLRATMAQQLREFTSDEALRLSELRARAVQARQEQFNNSELDLTLADKEAAAAAEAKRQQLWDEIEAEMARERAAGEQRLQDFRARLAGDLERDLARSERELWDRQKERTETITKSGSKTRSEMSKSVTAPEPLAGTGPLVWRAPSAKRAAADARTSRLAEKCRAQAARLEQERGRLEAEVARATQTALSGLAAMNGLNLSFPPTQDARGADMTEKLRPALRALYAGQPVGATK